jgi:perosamine synthetase
LTRVASTFLPVAEPVLSGREREYVLRCLETGWISGSGEFVERFEREFAEFCGTRYAIAVSNGTVALHLALLALGVGPGDEVIVPDLTYIATANAVGYCGATPVFADVEARTWCLDPSDVERRITPATRAVVAVHLFGHPADMDPLRELAARHGLALLEDAAEAHGAEYRGQRAGSLSDVATFSFYGNKVITTGEGGMLTTNRSDLAEHMRLRRGQGMDPKRRYWFPVVGYNYRMTNIQAAIGVAQLERIDWFLERRRQVARQYAALLAGAGLTLPGEAEWARNVYWLYSVVLPQGVDRELLMASLAEAGIETRPFFVPMHACPPYRQEDGEEQYPVSARLGNAGISLPSSATLTEDDVAYVATTLKDCLRRQS